MNGYDYETDPHGILKRNSFKGREYRDIVKKDEKRVTAKTHPVLSEDELLTVKQFLEEQWTYDEDGYDPWNQIDFIRKGWGENKILNREVFELQLVALTVARPELFKPDYPEGSIRPF